MKTKQNLLALAALVLVGVLCVYAGGDKLAKLKAELNLTDAQVSQLEKKFAELAPLEARAKAIKTDLEALKAAANPDAKAIEAKKAELATVKKEWKAKSDAIFRSVLTTEQYAKLEKMEADYEKKRVEHEKAEKEKAHAKKN